MLGVSLFISCKNKIQCVCVKKKKGSEEPRGRTGIKNEFFKLDFFQLALYTDSLLKLQVIKATKLKRN